MVFTGRKWDEVGKIDLNAPIQDIKFAPKSLSLVLAVACTDGVVSLFAPTQIDQLYDWQIKFNQLKKFTAGCNCLAWNPAFDEDPMILCGYQESSSQQQSQTNALLNVADVDSQD